MASRPSSLSASSGPALVVDHYLTQPGGKGGNVARAIARLGADRALSRAEIEKLALFAQGKPRIEIEDVDAIVVGNSAIAFIAVDANSGHVYVLAQIELYGPSGRVLDSH